MSELIKKLANARSIIAIVFFTLLGLVCVIAGVYGALLQGFLLTEKTVAINWWLVGFGGLCVFGAIRSVFISLKEAAKNKIEKK